MRSRRSFRLAPRPARTGEAAKAIDDGPRARCGEAGRRAGTARAQRYIVGITPVLEAIMRERGRTAQAIALELTRRAVRKPRGGMIWTSADAQRLLRRLTIGPPTDRPETLTDEDRALPHGAMRPIDEDWHG